MLAFLLIFLFPRLLQGHGCPTFTFSKDRELLNSGLLPESFKSFVAERNSSKFSGVYDCHEDQNGNEVAVNVICDAVTNECICESLFQFKSCQSCSLCADLSTIEYDQSVPRWLYSFSATCDDIDEEYPTCSVKCGFATKGCYPDTKSSGKRSNHLDYPNILFLFVLIFTSTAALKIL
jgi:hypothetical protein